MYKEKLCYIESCKKPFIPTSGNQLYCPQCGEKVKESKNKIRWRNKSRIRSNYKEYTRICKNPNCNKEFKTFYKKKIYCGSDICFFSCKRKETSFARLFIQTKTARILHSSTLKVKFVQCIKSPDR